MALLPTWSPAPIVFAAAAGALVAYYVASTAYQWHRLRKVPGPWLAGFSYLWIFKTLANGEHRPFEELGDKYGHLVRVGPNLLLTDLPDVLRRMSGTRSAYGKDEMYVGETFLVLLFFFSPLFPPFLVGILKENDCGGLGGFHGLTGANSQVRGIVETYRIRQYVYDDERGEA